MNGMIKVRALCGAVALGAGMFIGCSEQGDGAGNPALQGLANPALQVFTEEALRDGITQYGATDGCAIVMDAKTGAFSPGMVTSRVVVNSDPSSNR